MSKIKSVFNRMARGSRKTPDFIDGDAEQWYPKWKRDTDIWRSTIHLTIRQALEDKMPSGVLSKELEQALKGKCLVEATMRTHASLRSEKELIIIARPSYRLLKEIYSKIPEPKISVRRR